MQGLNESVNMTLFLQKGRLQKQICQQVSISLIHLQGKPNEKLLEENQTDTACQVLIQTKFLSFPQAIYHWFQNI